MRGWEAIGIPPVRAIPGMPDIGLAQRSPEPAGSSRIMPSATITADTGGVNSCPSIDWRRQPAKAPAPTALRGIPTGSRPAQRTEVYEPPSGRVDSWLSS